MLGSEAITIELRDYSRKVHGAIVRALNRAITSGQSVMVKAIAGDTKLKQKDVRGAMRLDKATLYKPQASLGASIKRIPLIDFGARQTRGGVSYRFGGVTRNLPNAFIAEMSNGHKGVFERTPGKFMRHQKPTWTIKRQAIHEKFGPSIAKVFRKFRPDGVARVNDVFEKNFDHELGFLGGGADAGTD